MREQEKRHRREKIREDFDEEEKRIFSLAEKAQGRGGWHERANKEKAKEGLAREWKVNSVKVGKERPP